MTELKEQLHKTRPSLSNSSLITYTSILKNLYYKVFGKETINLEKFEDTDKILHFLNDIPANRRKTILSALVIITDNKKYRDLMLEDVRDYNKEIHKQEKTPAQEASWVDSNQVKLIWEELKKDADLLYKKKDLKPSDLQQIQSFIILSLLGGVFIPPRRSKDYVDFYIKDINKEKDNYLEKNKMYFNSYKTAKTYGQQIVEIPKPLQYILKKWINVNPTKTLLFDAYMNPLSSVKLNQRLNKIFDEKKVSVNQLRHTYLTNKFGHTIDQKNKVNNIMSEMGSSAGMLDTYVKKD
jgi:integrase